MEKSTLEQILKQFYAMQSHGVSKQKKTQIKENVLAQFRIQRAKNRVPFFERFVPRRASYFAFGTVSLLVLFNILPLKESELSAGELQARGGLVEVTREGKTFLVRDVIKLRPGDTIQIGNNGEAKLLFPEYLESTLGAETRVSVLGKNSIFLDEGNMNTKTFQEGEISTNKGFVKTSAGSDFNIEVAKSGEVKVVSKSVPIDLYDWREGELMVRKGEEVRLRTETKLPKAEETRLAGTTEIKRGRIPVTLSARKSIEAKLIITRTKLISAVEKTIQNKKDEAKKDFISGEQSFKSLLESLGNESSENGKRLNLDSFTSEDVMEMLESTTLQPELIQDIRAVYALLSLIEKNQNGFAFGLESSGVVFFDRFVMVSRLFLLGSFEEQILGERLKQKYVENFVAPYKEKKETAEGVIRKSLERLPENKESIEFKTRVKALIPEMFQEKE